jgi:hypothetical protein
MPTPCVPSAYTLGFTAHPQSLIAPPFELEFDCFFFYTAVQSVLLFSGAKYAFKINFDTTSCQSLVKKS